MQESSTFQAAENLVQYTYFIPVTVFGNCLICNLIGKYLVLSLSSRLKEKSSRPYEAASFSFPRVHWHYSTTSATLAGTYSSGPLDHSSRGYKG